VGSALAARLEERGVELRSAGAGLTLLCGPGTAIPAVAQGLSPGPGWIAHVSRATPLSALDPHPRRVSLPPPHTLLPAAGGGRDGGEGGEGGGPGAGPGPGADAGARAVRAGRRGPAALPRRRRDRVDLPRRTARRCCRPVRGGRRAARGARAADAPDDRQRL